LNRYSAGFVQDNESFVFVSNVRKELLWFWRRLRRSLRRFRGFLRRK